MAEQGLQLSLGASVKPGPDGQPAIALVLDYGFSAHQILMSAEMAELVADKVAEELRNAAAEVRRARLGLIVPAPGPIDLSKLNGNGSAHG